MKDARIAAGRSRIARRSYSRRDFLKLGGAGLAGAALLGTAAGCGGSGGSGSGGGNITFTYGSTGSEDLRTVQELVDRFNQENENGITVEFQQRSEVTDEYFRSLVSDFQAGSASVDVIAGDVIWGRAVRQQRVDTRSQRPPVLGLLAAGAGRFPRRPVELGLLPEQPVGCPVVYRCGSALLPARSPRRSRFG